MDTVIYNLFLVNNIDIIEDIQDVIKNTLFSCSMILIVPPLEKWDGNISILYNNITFWIMTARFPDHNIIMSLSTTRVFYDIGIFGRIVYFLMDELDINKIYIPVLGNLTPLNQIPLIKNHNYITFEKIHPIYYFP